MEFIPIDFAHEDQIWVQECMDRLKSAYELASIGPELAANHRFRWPPPKTEVAALLLADALLAFEFPTADVSAQDTIRANTELAVGQVATWLLDLVRAVDEGFDQEESRLLQALAAQRVAQLYSRFRSHGLRRCEGKLLQVLLSTRLPSAVVVGIDLLVDQPPVEWSNGSLAISVLIQSHHWRIQDVFPRIFDSTNPSILSPALDLANLMVRQRGVSPHPAAALFDRMLTLLGGVTQQLAAIEENPSRFSNRVSEIQRMLFEGISLAVSLCHFFALCGDPRAIAKLTQTLDLSHRRIKVEAAYALAKLGELRAIDLLLELVEDDATRPRVLAYTEELGIEDRIDPQWHSSLAQAKSQLALWLSQPDQFSLAPQRIELLEQRTLPWPGMDRPQECFLLRFEYLLGEAQYGNIGFAGPCVHAFPFEVGQLSTQELFSMFLAHDIDDSQESHTAWDMQNAEQQRRSEPWLEALADLGYMAIKPTWVLEFLGNQALVVEAIDNRGKEVCALVDEEGCNACGRSPYAMEYLRVRWKGRGASVAMDL